MKQELIIAGSLIFLGIMWAIGMAAFAGWFDKKKKPKCDKSISELQEELRVTELLLNDRQKLLDNIPECPVHGKCTPYALEWIEKMKDLERLYK